MQYFLREGSDHAPLHVLCRSLQVPIVKPFGFLNFWTKHHSYKGVVEKLWEYEIEGSPFFVFNEKLKKLKKALSLWSKNTYGDFLQNLATLEDLVRI